MKKLCLLLVIFISYLAFAQWTTSGTNIYNSNTGYVGIGTNSPLSKLHINSANARETLRIYFDGNTTNYLNIWQGTGGAILDPIGTGLLYFGYDQPTTVIMGLNSGKIGIGTTSPQEKLHVEGNIYVNTNQVQFLSASGGVNRIQSYGGTTVGTWQFKSRFDNIILDAGENSGNERNILFRTGGTERMMINS